MGLSVYDKEFLNQEQQAAILKANAVWNDPNSTAEEKEAARQVGVDIRAQAGYYGGQDGSEYNKLSTAQTGTTQSGTTSGAYTGSTAQQQLLDQISAAQAQREASLNTQRQLLEQQTEAAKAQQQASIDYNVQQQVDALNRALADAQPQYQAQAESIARDERQGMDNSALYAELRGDRGGIGQSQYNEIQAAAAQNRQQVQSAQIQLATDTQRQIEDLRAQGEFAKADAALQLSQQYLQQLASLEQWAAEYNLSAEQFNAELIQWQLNYEQEMAQFNASLQLSYDQLGQDQAQYEGDLGYKYAALGQDQQQFAASLNSSNSQNTQSTLSSMGAAMLEAGIMPTDEQLSAMGLTKSQATSYIQQAQLAAAQSAAGSSAGSSGETSGAQTGIVETMLSKGSETKAYEYLVGLNLSKDEREWLWAMYQKEQEAAVQAAQAAETEQTAAAQTSTGMSAQNFAAFLQTLGQYQSNPTRLKNYAAQNIDRLSDAQAEQVETLLKRWGVSL